MLGLIILTQLIIGALFVLLIAYNIQVVGIDLTDEWFPLLICTAATLWFFQSAFYLMCL